MENCGKVTEPFHSTRVNEKLKLQEIKPEFGTTLVVMHGFGLSLGVDDQIIAYKSLVTILWSGWMDYWNKCYKNCHGKFCHRKTLELHLLISVGTLYLTNCAKMRTLEMLI